MSTISTSVFWSTSSFIQLSVLYSTFSIIIRLELGVSGTFIFDDGNQTGYYRAVTSHGLGMVFLFIMPGIISGLGNFSVPTGTAALDFATPRLNNLAFWLSVFAIQILICGISVQEGVAAGWTLYFPLTGIDFSSSAAVSLAIFFLHVLGLSSEFGAITFMVSIQISRSVGLSVLSFCLISWSILVVSFLLITTLPVLGAGITILFAERVGNLPSLLGLSVDGGDPVIFQHLFWFFGHPEVYVIILPAFGLISEKIRCLSSDKVLSHPGMTLAIWSIGLVGFFVWAHHMFSVGMGTNSQLYFSAATAVIGIPTAIKIFAWALGMGEISIKNLEWILVLSFVVCFLFGGFTGLILANSTVDLAFHDSYFVVGHFHYVLSISAAIATIIFFFTLFREATSTGFTFMKILSWVVLGIWAVNVLFAVLHFVGIEGHPRRVFLSPEIFVANQSFANFSLLPLVLAFLAVGSLSQHASSTFEPDFSSSRSHHRF